jgi:hypothetical protein
VFVEVNFKSVPSEYKMFFDTLIMCAYTCTYVHVYHFRHVLWHGNKVRDAFIDTFVIHISSNINMLDIL